MNDSAGAAGCPLAQTMAEGGLKVLLLERGGEKVETSKTVLGAVDTLSDKCTETIRSTDGVTLGTGNCMGGTSVYRLQSHVEMTRSNTRLIVVLAGATSVNQGIFIQEDPGRLISMISPLNGTSAFNATEISAAYDWVRPVVKNMSLAVNCSSSSLKPFGPFQIRERVAPEPTSEPPGSASETYINNLLRIYQNRSDFTVGNIKPGQPFLPKNDSNVVWRAHSTFHPITGARRSSDTNQCIGFQNSL
jgi:choline dehydrogenase-like flavoprotein